MVRKIMISDVVAHAREEINKLRHANEDLTNQVEGLQMNRFSEVEELVYLRWVNACLRYELRNYQTPSEKISARDLNKTLSPKSRERAKLLIYSFFGKRPNLMQKLKKWGRGKDDGSSLASPTRSLTGDSPKSTSQKPKGPLEALMLRNAGDGMGITTFGKREQDPSDIMDEANVASSFQLMSKTVQGFADDKYPAYKDRHKLATEREKAIKEKAEKARVQRYGGVNSSGLLFSPKAALPPKLAQIKEKAPTANAESSEQSSDNQNNPLVVTQLKLANIEKRAPRVPRPPPAPSASASGAVKADVETQGDSVESLANEVRAANFVNIDNVVAFVNWLDEELSLLVDERAVLKHFGWPESKTDALREAAFEYQDLLKLEHKVSSFPDDPKLPCEEALKKMYSLLEKVEQSVYALFRTRDMAISRYREYGIPVDWLYDSGVIKLASVQLAKKYMKRVATELDALQGTEKEPNREFLLLQGVRFAFRVHQFAGGFDEEGMKA
ncbi:hypothetical protein E2562_033861 [Oryza meyeriana var. granulata]|uniref:Protein CHUP1, chloroplastic n=1 Tax=Oryza meyeriana var. granulata TaxID=110450 RepID=A0A6G1BPX7_9ORYZ|nr:hypothetical protein E2562_033861 [Oryza meyeriana var. granulata]